MLRGASWGSFPIFLYIFFLKKKLVFLCILQMFSYFIFESSQFYWLLVTDFAINGHLVVVSLKDLFNLYIFFFLFKPDSFVCWLYILD